MPTIGEKFRALLATGRVANLPTVWSNVLMAYSLAWVWSTQDLHDYSVNFDFISLGWAILSASLLYVGGCMLGDYIDITFDKQNRPNRPLPKGVISKSFVLCLSLSFIALANVFITSRLPESIISGTILSIAIVSYACTHKQNQLWAITNMALCRTFLILFSMSLTTVQVFQASALFTLFPVAIYVGIYTSLLSYVAATEHDDHPFINRRKLLFLAQLSLPLSLALVFELPLIYNSGLPYVGALTIYLAWTIYSFNVLPRSKPAFVSRALAGFCLLDACIAATFSLPITLICLGLFGLALLLQKITPAT